MLVPVHPLQRDTDARHQRAASVCARRGAGLHLPIAGLHEESMRRLWLRGLLEWIQRAQERLAGRAAASACVRTFADLRGLFIRPLPGAARREAHPGPATVGDVAGIAL